MKLGDTAWHAAWLTGAETPEVRADFETRVREGIQELCREKGFLPGPVKFRECRPGEGNVPEVPDHIQGPDVRLLIGEADIIAPAPRIERRSFLGELDQKDLARLRRITRKAWQKHYRHRPISDLEIDDIIETLGPEAALDALRKAANGTTLH